MKHEDLKQFMDKIAAINSDYAGMGGASAGIMGVASMPVQLVDTLRRDAAAFAAEYTKPKPEKLRVEKLAGQLEGSLRALNLINAISTKRLEELLFDLQRLADDTGFSKRANTEDGVSLTKE